MPAHHLGLSVAQPGGYSRPGPGPRLMAIPDEDDWLNDDPIKQDWVLTMKNN